MNKVSGYISVILITVIISYLLFSKKGNNYIGYKNDTYYASNSKLAHQVLNRALSEDSHVAWSTGNHTASPVPCGAVGPEKYIKKLNGLIQNTEIAKVTHQAINDGINVLLIIGDGMGINHMSLPIYMRIAEKNNEKTYFEKILNEGSCGITLNNPVGGLVTGSATSGTTLATGVKSYLEVIGVDTNGYPLRTTVDVAKDNNFISGLITDAGITDGTPAAFYAHSYNRDLENYIAEQLTDSEIDIIFGGAAAKFIPKDTKLKDYKYFSNSLKMGNSLSERNDNKNLLEKFENNKYKIISSKNDLKILSPDVNKVLGLFAPGGISAAIDRDTEDTGEPSITDMTTKALEIINNKKQNYFMMIEAGRIDWEAHDNDIGSVYRAMEELNDILEVCYNQYKENSKNTLLIFTADHETGGLSISYTKVKKENMFTKKLKSGDSWFSKTDPLFFKNFIKIKNQKRALHRDFGTAKNENELYELLNDNLDYDVTYEDAKIIYEIRNKYKKGK